MAHILLLMSKIIRGTY